jgi:hypothetical protein
MEFRQAGVVGRAHLGVKYAVPQSAPPIASYCDSSLCGYSTDPLGAMAILMTCGGVKGYLAIVPGQSQLQALCMTMYLVPEPARGGLLRHRGPPRIDFGGIAPREPHVASVRMPCVEEGGRPHGERRGFLCTGCMPGVGHRRTTRAGARAASAPEDRRGLALLGWWPSCGRAALADLVAVPGGTQPGDAYQTLSCGRSQQYGTRGGKVPIYNMTVHIYIGFLPLCSVRLEVRPAIQGELLIVAIPHGIGTVHFRRAVLGVVVWTSFKQED